MNANDKMTKADLCNMTDGQKPKTRQQALGFRLASVSSYVQCVTLRTLAHSIHCKTLSFEGREKRTLTDKGQ